MKGEGAAKLGKKEQLMKSILFFAFLLHRFKKAI